MNSAKLQEIFQTKQFTDVTIKVKDKTVEAHKVLLAETSPVLYKLLNSGTLKVEGTSSNSNTLFGSFNKFKKNLNNFSQFLNNQNVLELNNLEFVTLEIILKFIYGQKFEITENNARALLIAANSVRNIP